MTPELAYKITQICIAMMGVVGIIGLIAIYIDMNNEDKQMGLIRDIVVMIAMCFILLIVTLIIHIEYA